MKNKIIVQDLGTIPFKAAWDYQYARQAELIQTKLFYRDNPDAPPADCLQHFFLWCEHTPVYTLGKTGDIKHLLLSEAELEAHNIDFYKINRGGDITFHGLGQVVGYPIFDMEGFFLDIGKYVRFVEEAAIRTCADYGVTAQRSEGESGAWVADASGRLRKICAVGIHLSRWVTMHGFAFNVNTDLDYFKNIVPCGIADKGVTSLQNEINTKIDENEVKTRLLHHYETLFGGEFLLAKGD